MLRVRHFFQFALAMLVLALATGAGSAEAPKLNDQAIADAIEDQFLVDRTVDVNRIDVEVNEGIVELTGQVDNLLAKQRADRIAGRVKGVRSVIDRIRVIPSVVLSDDGIAQDVRQALKDDPAAEPYEITVSVQDNVVTLGGAVDSWTELQLAEKVVSSVRGVVAVDNQLQVRLPERRMASEIREEIEQRLRWSVLVNDGLIDVSVADGAVTLSGTVGSLEEKNLAESLARVTGVESVDASALGVQWWADDEALLDGKYARRTDDEIRRAVEDAALYDPRLQSFKIDPEVHAGWVTLRGRVDNLAAKRAAERVARNTVGVAGVTNRLKVRPRALLADDVIEAAIVSRLVVNPITPSSEIEVSVEDGKAVLIGTVDSYLERKEAGRLAGQAAGVTRVSNRLRVVYDRERSEPYYGYDFPTMTATLDRMPPGRGDQEIHDEIHDELVWSPFVDADQVDIDVQNGWATLTGTVTTWREYHAAEDNAYQGGAWMVTNRLKVE